MSPTKPAAASDQGAPDAPADVAVPVTVDEKHAARIAEARETLGLDKDGKPKPPPKLPPPVYDERGNVRPRGTPGAKPMSYDERVKIAQRLAAGEKIVTTSERKSKT